MDDVVGKWLETTSRSAHLRTSLVRYLKHLEDTTEAFPVHVVGNLVEVHEEFGL